MSFETGGPAFPCKEVSLDFGEDGIGDKETVCHPGMSLRDYFAGQALAGWMASCQDVKWPDAITPEAGGNCAILAYRFADAMLAERARSGAA